MEKAESTAKGLQMANQGKQQITRLEIKSVRQLMYCRVLWISWRFYFWSRSKRCPSLLSADLEAKVEASQSAQQQLQERVEQTASEVEEVKMTVFKGKTLSRLKWLAETFT